VPFLNFRFNSWGNVLGREGNVRRGMSHGRLSVATLTSGAVASVQIAEGQRIRTLFDAVQMLPLDGSRRSSLSVSERLL